ncbi:MAG: hypothetical protein HZA04_05920 [Nitrospinae bacterium]|nr:hypothetical protein [Nitrospinota bacterium]
MFIKLARATIFILAVLFLGTGNAVASQYFADETGKECAYCHEGTPQDLKFTADGEAFIKNYNQLPPKVGLNPESLKAPLMKKVRRMLSALHGVAGIALLGALIFIALAHPARVEEEGLSADHRKFLWITLATAGLAGAALVPFAISSGTGWQSVFGVLLIAKMALFAALAALVAMSIAAAKKVDAARHHAEEELRDLSKFTHFSAADLKMFTGRGGRRALFAFKGKVYDLTDHPHWLHGIHFARHSAGRDLTEDILKAPHSPAVIDKHAPVGTYDANAKQSGLAAMNELRGLSARYYGLVKLSAGLAVGVAAIVSIWRQM